MDPVITRFTAVPDYSSGFMFVWSVNPSFSAPSPWTFVVQEATAVDGPWNDISPELSGVMAWKESKRWIGTKGYELFFRVRMSAGGETYFSHTSSPYGDLSRRDYLIARDVMRREVLHSRGMAGVEVVVYRVNTSGSQCSACRDPISGMTMDSHCKVCFGTGRNPPYFGPYAMWASFSGDTNHNAGLDGTGGNVEQKAFRVRMISAIPLRKNDVIVDLRSDKRYYVDAASVVAEMRRVPIVQEVVANEAATTDVIYRLGAAK